MSPTRIVGGLGRVLSRWSERLVPDPFIFAILLTLIALICGFQFFYADVTTLGELSALSAGESLEHNLVAVDISSRTRWLTVLAGWSASFFSAGGLTFAFQMCLVLVTGHALALSRPVQTAVKRISKLPRNTAEAAAIVALVAELSGIVHWGLGAVVGAFLAREIGRAAALSGRKIDYPILGAAAYLGLLVWHGGLSGSGPLLVAESGHFLVDKMGVIPTSETIGSSLNWIVSGVVCAIVPLAFWLMAPRNELEFVPYAESESPVEIDLDSGNKRSGIAGHLENSKLLAGLIALIGLGWLIRRFALGQAQLDLNVVNFFFLFAGIAVQGTLIRYVRAVSDGAKACGGIILQFPFYFGVLGVLKASGLVGRLSDMLATVPNEGYLSILTFLSAGLVNLFVPSGGGQWTVQGEVLVDASARVGADLSHTIMAFSYGDQLTNLLQPFWALPLLAITGLKARQIIGYTGAIMLLVTPIYIGLLLLL